MIKEFEFFVYINLFINLIRAPIPYGRNSKTKGHTCPRQVAISFAQQIKIIGWWLFVFELKLLSHEYKRLDCFIFNLLLGHKLYSKRASKKILHSCISLLHPECLRLLKSLFYPLLFEN